MVGVRWFTQLTCQNLILSLLSCLRAPNLPSVLLIDVIQLTVLCMRASAPYTDEIVNQYRQGNGDDTLIGASMTISTSGTNVDFVRFYRTSS